MLNNGYMRRKTHAADFLAHLHPLHIGFTVQILGCDHKHIVIAFKLEVDALFLCHLLDSRITCVTAK